MISDTTLARVRKAMKDHNSVFYIKCISCPSYVMDLNDIIMNDDMNAKKFIEFIMESCIPPLTTEFEFIQGYKL